jgi:hypothetical protein
MSTTSVSPLRQRMIEDMRLRNLAPRTQEAYIRGCKKLAAFLRRSPDTATAEDVRLFHHRRRPEAARRQDRHHRRAPHLGLGDVSKTRLRHDDAASARAHDRAGRRAIG